MKMKIKKPRSGTKTITFDEDARKDFLTGFSKRKKERAQHARRKIAVEVRAEKLKDREMRREERKERLGIMDDELEEEEEEEDDGEEEGEDPNAEQNSYIVGDTLTTTVVESLLEDPEEDSVAAPSLAKKQDRISWMGSKRGSGDSSSKSGKALISADAKEKLMQKKFDLSKPLASVIPGYKAPVGLKKKKKVKKRKTLSKKEKQKARMPQR
jgi:ribosomal RNA-processing protein 17